MTDIPTSSPGGSSRLAWFDRWYTRLENALNAVAGLSILLLMFFAVAQIAGRTLLNLPIPGYIDWVTQAMVLFTFLAITYCQRVGSHIRMELVIGRFKGRALWIAEALGVIVAMVFIGILIPTSYEHFLRAYELGDSTIDVGLPTWPSKLAVPVSFAFLWLRLLLQLAGYIRLAIRPDAEPVAVPEVVDAEKLVEREIREALGDDEEGRRQ